jgi:two-component system C4-dicarboxylate transport response regulator DctD
MPFRDLDHLKDALRDGDGESATPARDARPIVFVVDDDASIRQSLELLLQATYRVRTYPGASEALAAMDENVAVVVLDVKMTGLDGFATYKRMREKDADVPIIFYSAYQDIKDPYEIINEYRPFGYITKGADHTMLLRSVAAAADQRTRTMKHRRLIAGLASIEAQMESLRKGLAE